MDEDSSVSSEDEFVIIDVPPGVLGTAADKGSSIGSSFSNPAADYEQVVLPPLTGRELINDVVRRRSVVDLELLRMFGKTSVTVSNDKDMKKVIENMFNTTEKGPDVKPRRNERRKLKLMKDPELGYGFWLQTYGFGSNTAESETNQRTFVRFVEDEGPGYIAGLREGDVILEVGEENVEKNEHPAIVELIKQHEKELILVVMFFDAVKRVQLLMRLKKKEVKLKARTNELEQITIKERELLENVSPFNEDIAMSGSRKLKPSGTSLAADINVKHSTDPISIESALSLPLDTTARDASLPSPTSFLAFPSFANPDGPPLSSADEFVVQTSQFNKRTSVVVDTTNTLNYLERQMNLEGMVNEEAADISPHTTKHDTERMDAVTDTNLLHKFSGNPHRAASKVKNRSVWYTPTPDTTVRTNGPPNTDPTQDAVRTIVPPTTNDLIESDIFRKASKKRIHEEEPITASSDVNSDADVDNTNQKPSLACHAMFIDDMIEDSRRKFSDGIRHRQANKTLSIYEQLGTITDRVTRELTRRETGESATLDQADLPTKNATITPTNGVALNNNIQDLEQDKLAYIIDFVPEEASDIVDNSMTTIDEENSDTAFTWHKRYPSVNSMREEEGTTVSI